MKPKLIAAIVLLSACAAAPFLSNAALEMPTETQMKPLQIDGLYRFTNFKEVTPVAAIVDGKIVRPESEEDSYVFRKREPVRAVFLNNGNVRITRGVSPDEIGVNPSVIEVPAEQFNATDLVAINDSYGRDLQTLYVEYLTEDNTVASRGRHGGHHYGGTCSISNWGNGGCVNYIKGTEGIHAPLGNGGSVAFTLRAKYGYRTANCDNPAVGTIASWPGHVGKWDGSCWRTNVPAACSCNRGDPGRGKPLLCVIKGGGW